MIGLSNIAKDDMLAAFAGKIFSLALFTGEQEIQDAIYARQPVLFSNPVAEGDVRYVENVEIIRFEGFNARHLIDHWGVIDEHGELYALYRVLESLEVSPVMDCKFRPGELRIGLP